MAQGRSIEVHRLGTVLYEDGLAWQRAASEVVRAGAVERVALLEHAPVYTIGAGVGARGSRLGLRVAEQDLPAPLVISTRGGDVTFHGPGQLVLYPVLDLRSRGLRPGDYVRALEESVLAALAALGVAGERCAGRPGAWVRLDGPSGALAKVAAIGVRVQHGVTSHGLALNVSTDLRWFEPIVPCGIEDAGVTSLAHVLGRAPSMEDAGRALLEGFAHVFEATLVEAPERVHLDRMTAARPPDPSPGSGRTGRREAAYA